MCGIARPALMHCKVCGRQVGRAALSKRGKCAPCGERRTTVAITQLRDKRGLFYDMWLVHQAEAIARLHEQRGSLDQAV